MRLSIDAPAGRNAASSLRSGAPERAAFPAAGEGMGRLTPGEGSYQAYRPISTWALGYLA